MVLDIKSAAASRVQECESQLSVLKDKKHEVVLAHKDAIQDVLRKRVADFVTSIEDEVTAQVCGDELADINKQIDKVTTDLSIFKSCLEK